MLMIHPPGRSPYGEGQHRRVNRDHRLRRALL
jgi:hypothetical protein